MNHEGHEDHKERNGRKDVLVLSCFLPFVTFVVHHLKENA
jgi:hypothetical protein